MSRRRILAGLVPAAIAAAALVATGAALSKTGPSSKGTASVLPPSSCGPLFYKGKGKPKLIIASDLPLQGATRAQTIQMTKAAQFELLKAKFLAGKFTVGYQSCDDSTAQAAKWDPAKCTANAQAYAADKSVGLVLGTFNSGCAKLVIPILNRAPNGPLGMVSPANTYPGLTHAAGQLTAAGEPNVYYPTGKRNYIRVVGTDDVQGPADALYLKQVGVKSVYILTDNETYGKGVALGFQGGAKKLGIEVKGFQAWDPKASSYEALASTIKQSGAEAVFLGGIICNNGGKLIKDLRAGLGSNVRLSGPDGFTPFDAVLSGSGGAAEGMIVSVAGYPNNLLGPTGKAFVKAFTKFQKRVPDPYAVYMAQAAEIGLQAIAKSNGTRASITAQLFKTKIKGGILGTFFIDKNGDTSSKAITEYRITASSPTKNVPVKVIIPPASLIG